MLKHVNKENFESEVLKNNGVVIADFLLLGVDLAK